MPALTLSWRSQPRRAAAGAVSRSGDPFTRSATSVRHLRARRRRWRRRRLMQGDVQNAGINAGVAVGAGALYFVDQQATGALKEKTREEIENPMLGGGIKSYLDIDGDEEDDVPEAAPAPAEAAAPPSGAVRLTGFATHAHARALLYRVYSGTASNTAPAGPGARGPWSTTAATRPANVRGAPARCAHCGAFGTSQSHRCMNLPVSRNKEPSARRAGLRRPQRGQRRSSALHDRAYAAFAADSLCAQSSVAPASSSGVGNADSSSSWCLHTHTGARMSANARRVKSSAPRAGRATGPRACTRAARARPAGGRGCWAAGRTARTPARPARTGAARETSWTKPLSFKRRSWKTEAREIGARLNF